MQSRDTIKTQHKPKTWIPKEQQHREKEKGWTRFDMKRHQTA